MKKVTSSLSHLNRSIRALIRRKFERFFRFLAKICTKRPRVNLLILLILSIGLSFGLFNGKINFDQEKLWSSPSDDIIQLKNNYQNTFEGNYGVIQIIGTVKESKIPEIGDDVIQYKVLKEVFYLERNLSAIQYGDINMTEACLQPVEGICYTSSPLNFWDYNLEKIKSDSDLHKHVSWDKVNHPLGFRLEATSIFGGIRYHPTITTKISNASAFIISTILKDRDRENVGDWLKVITEYITKANDENEYTKLYLLHCHSFYHEIENALLSQWWLIPISFSIILIFVCLTLGGFSITGSRIGLSLFSVLLLLTSIIVSLAVSSLIGIEIAPLALQVFPTLLLSVGIDNVFLMVKTFSNIREKHSTTIEEAIAKMLTLTGPSIALTNLTLATIFLVCAIIDVAIIRSLSFQIGISLYINYIFQMFGVCSAIAIDEERVMANKMDVLFCFSYPASLSPKEISKEEKPSKDYYTLAVSYFIGKKMRIAIIIIFTIIAAVSILFVTRTTVGLLITDALPSNSYAVEYMDKSSKYFHDKGYPFFVILPELDYANWEVQDNLKDLIGKIEDLEIVNNMNFWFSNFISWVAFLRYPNEYRVNGHIPPDKFYPWLDEFLNAEGKALSLEIIFNEEHKIKASRALGELVNFNTTNDLVNAYYTIQNTLHNNTINGFYSYSLFYPLIAQFISLFETTAKILGIVLGGIFIITLLYFNSLILSLLIVFLLSISCMEMVALQSALGLGFNVVSTLLLASGLGLGIEYLAHVFHMFTLSTGKTSNERVIEAAEAIGIPILLSLSSSVVGLSILLLMEFKMIRLYFAVLWITMILLSGFHALVLAPVILSILPLRYLILEADEDNFVDRIDMTEPFKNQDESSSSRSNDEKQIKLEKLRDSSEGIETDDEE